MITVSANRAYPGDSPQIPAQGDDSPAGELPKPTMAADSRGPDRPTAAEPPSPPPDHPLVQGTPVPPDQAEMSLSDSEKAQISLDRADQAEKSIDGSNTWQGVVGRVKFVMDTLSPVAGVRVINLRSVYSRLSRLALSSIRLHRWRMECFQ